MEEGNGRLFSSKIYPHIHSKRKGDIAMPKFSIVQEKEVGKMAVPQELIEEYKSHIEELEKQEKGFVGKIEFEEGENIKIGKKALQEAASQLDKYIKVQKVRGSANLLRVKLISKEEHEEAKKIAQARAAKLKGKPRAKKKK